MGRFPLAAIVARRRREQTPKQRDRSLRIGRVVTLLVIGAIAVSVAVGTAWLLLWWVL